MRTADRIRARGVYHPPGEDSAGAPIRERGLWDPAPLLAGIPVLVADNVADYVGAIDEDIVIEERWPTLAPPWPVFWIEYPSSSGRQRRGVLVRDVTDMPRTPQGSFQMAVDDAATQSPDHPVRWLVDFAVYIENERHQVVGPWAWWVAALDETGFMAGNRWVFGMRSGPEVVDKFSGDVTWLTRVLMPAWQAIAFLHCFAGETKILTRRGPVPIEELSGSEVEVLAKSLDGPTRRGHASWHRATVQHFGQQPLVALTVERNGVRQVIRTTAGHRWFAQRPGRRREPVVEVTTSSLRPDDRLLTVRPHPAGANCKESAVGVAHGLVYGDGSRNDHEAWAEFLGDDREDMLRFFPEPRVMRLPNRSTGAIRVSGLPRSWKELPREDEGTAYLYSFLRGWFAADGDVGRQGQVRLSCADSRPLAWLRRVALAQLGMVIGEPYWVLREGINGETSPLWTVLIDRGSVNAAFFVRAHHRARYEAIGPPKEPNRWRVVSVKQTGEVDDVYCAVVPGPETFVVDGMILTGNCRNIHTNIVHPPAKLSRKHERRTGLPLLSYHELRLEVPRRQSGPGSNGAGAERSLHIVAGNFHHYGNCCPGAHDPKGLLFGRLEGIYWVPSHARGNPERGGVRTDFDLVVER